jgi:hypothetical protein
MTDFDSGKCKHDGGEKKFWKASTYEIYENITLTYLDKLYFPGKLSPRW